MITRRNFFLRRLLRVNTLYAEEERWEKERATRGRKDQVRTYKVNKVSQDNRRLFTNSLLNVFFVIWITMSKPNSVSTKRYFGQSWFVNDGQGAIHSWSIWTWNRTGLLNWTYISSLGKWRPTVNDVTVEPVATSYSGDVCPEPHLFTNNHFWDDQEAMMRRSTD